MYNTILTARYNHSKFMQEVAEGRKLIDNIQIGTELQKYQVGQFVDGNGFGFYSGVIIEAYKDNGYYYYVISYKWSARSRKVMQQTLRQRDIKIVTELFYK